jgi:anti-anti-sigma regulatory factor
MIHIEKSKTEAGLILSLRGEFDENVRLHELLGPVSGPLVFDTKGVTRINSAGARNWIHYFEGLQRNQVPFSFVECSPAIVDQMNLISNFRAGGPVISIYIPFACSTCRAELFGLFQIKELLQRNGKVPDQPCNQCQGTAHFDEIEDEYEEAPRPRAAARPTTVRAQAQRDDSSVQLVELRDGEGTRTYGI